MPARITHPFSGVVAGSGQTEIAKFGDLGPKAVAILSPLRPLPVESSCGCDFSRRLRTKRRATTASLALSERCPSVLCFAGCCCWCRRHRSPGLLPPPRTRAGYFSLSAAQVGASADASRVVVLLLARAARALASAGRALFFFLLLWVIFVRWHWNRTFPRYFSRVVQGLIFTAEGFPYLAGNPPGYVQATISGEGNCN